MPCPLGSLGFRVEARGFSPAKNAAESTGLQPWEFFVRRGRAKESITWQDIEKLYAGCAVGKG